MSGGLWVDVDFAALEQMARDLMLEKPQIRAAMTRAIQRTRSTLRADSARGLKARMNLRTTTRLRRRIKVRWLKRDQEVELWYGENDFPVRDFRGRPVAAGGDVTFGEHRFPGAFIGRPFQAGPSSVWRRVGAARFPVQEVMVPVKDQMDVFLEDVVFEKAGDLLLGYFEHEIKARGIFGVGR